MKSSFIHTKLRTTDDIDWAGALKNYLTKLYGSQSDFSKEVNIINKLRLDVTNSITTDNEADDERTRNAYYKYYGQLELLDLRLPIQEHGGVRLKFRWYDAYDHSTYHSQHSLAFEKASVLFNLASVLSRSAAYYFKETDYKKSYQFFQYSAGIYKFISENFLHAPSNDLSGKTVIFLQQLNLSQAQEVFLLKLISEDNDESKTSLIARLAGATANHYEQTASSLEKLHEDEGNDFGTYHPWKQNIYFKQHFYYNLSLYNYALSVESKKVGEAITFLQLAIDGFTTLKKYENHTDIDFKSYFSKAEDKVRLLEKDNDFIYHATIPSKESVDVTATIKPFDAVKAIPLNDHSNISEIIGEDVFEKIIPMSVHEKLSLYSEEKAQLLRGEIEKDETTNIELESFLEYLRLPSSLEDFKNSARNKLDPKIISWSSEIRASSLSDVQHNRSVISSKREEILKLIKDLDAKLQQEEADYLSKRSQIGSSQEPSAVQSANLKDELTNAKQSLLSATKLDQQISKTIDVEAANLEVLGSQQRLEAAFFGNATESLLDLDDSVNEQVDQYIKKIEDDLKILSNMKRERRLIIEDLKNKIHEDDISNILVLNNKKLSEKEEKIIFQQELTKFEPLTTRLDSIIFKQPDLIKDIKIHYDKIISSNSNVSEKAHKISKFEATYHAFKEYEANFSKSTQFYQNLLNFVFEVKSNIDKFVADRYAQRQRILSTSSSSSFSSQAPTLDPLRDRFNQLNISRNSSYSEQPQLQPRQASFASSTSSTSYQQPNPSQQQSLYASPSYLSYQKPSPQQYTQPSPSPYSQPVPPSLSQPVPQPSYQQQSVSPYQHPSQQSQPLQSYQQQDKYAGAPPLPHKADSNDNRIAFYNTPPTFQDCTYSSYSQYKPQPPAPQQSQHGFTQPYDPNQPYN